VSECLTFALNSTEISAYLTERKKIHEVICKKIEDKYGPLDLLEKGIEEEGVPLDNHTLWDNAIEWRNAVAAKI